MIVSPGDVILLDEKPLRRRDHLVYILINKPKAIAPLLEATPPPDDADAPPKAPTNLGELLKFRGVEQLSALLPLSTEMMGLQLVTNDGALAEHFAAHPPKQTITITLAEPGDEDLPQRLLDGEYAPSELLVAEYAGSGDGDDARTKLSLVFRGPFPADQLAEQGLTYERADRLHFAGLTKKDLPRGHWRFLSEKEVTWVTMFEQ